MAALDRVVSTATVQSYVARAKANKAIWQWFDEHKDEVYLRIGFWKFSSERHISDLYPIIVRIAGNR